MFGSEIADFSLCSRLDISCMSTFCFVNTDTLLYGICCKF
jgi:hypothetical protein